jgi:hypothetical protein
MQFAALFQGLQFEWTINVGHLFTAAVVVVSLIVAWTRLNDRQRTIELWIEKHEKFVETQMPVMTDLRDAIVELKLLSTFMDKRITMLENEKREQ